MARSNPASDPRAKRAARHRRNTFSVCSTSGRPAMPSSSIASPWHVSAPPHALSAAGAHCAAHHCAVALHVLTWLYDKRSLMIASSAMSGRGNAAALERSLRLKRDAAQNHNAVSK